MSSDEVDREDVGGVRVKALYSLAELAEPIALHLKKYGMASARLFGSCARGEATATSDMDLHLEGKAGFRPLGVYGVAEELRYLTGKDVVVYEISEHDGGPFRSTVLVQAVAR